MKCCIIWSFPLLPFLFWQILDLCFSIALSLPRPVMSGSGVELEISYRALSSLEDVIAILKSVCIPPTNHPSFPQKKKKRKWRTRTRKKKHVYCRAVWNRNMLIKMFIFLPLYPQDASIDPSEVFNRIVSSICTLLTKDEVSFSFRL